MPGCFMAVQATWGMAAMPAVRIGVGDGNVQMPCGCSAEEGNEQRRENGQWTPIHNDEATARKLGVKSFCDCFDVGRCCRAPLPGVGSRLNIAVVQFEVSMFSAMCQNGSR